MVEPPACTVESGKQSKDSKLNEICNKEKNSRKKIIEQIVTEILINTERIRYTVIINLKIR